MAGQKRPSIPTHPSNALLVMEAFALAGYLALFTPSLLGVAPIERFIRQRRADADDATRAALDALAQTSFHLIQLESRASPRTLLVKDLANGESLSLFDEDIPDSACDAMSRRGSRRCRTAILSRSGP